MEISLSNAYYMCAKSTTNPIAKNVKDFRESVVTNLIGPPPNCHLKPQASFHLLYHQQKKKRKVQNMQTLFWNQKHQEWRYGCLMGVSNVH